MSHLYKGIIYNIHLSFFLQMLYLRARLSRRRSWLIVVGAGHFHPAVLVPRVGPVSEGGWCLGWREMGWYLHFAIIIMTMRKSFTSCIQTILKVNYLWGRIDFHSHIIFPGWAQLLWTISRSPEIEICDFPSLGGVLIHSGMHYILFLPRWCCNLTAWIWFQSLKLVVDPKPIENSPKVPPGLRPHHPQASICLGKERK